MLVNEFMRYVGSTWAPCFPAYLQIEPTNVCDQKCPFCETGSGALIRKRGMMSLETFKKIMDEFGKYANFIDLYMMGEPFLNREIYDMVAYAKRWPVTVKTDTNGMAIDPVKTIECGLDEVWFQLGGVDQETHAVYRRRGDLGKALDNVRVMVQERKRRNDYHTRIKMGMIIMKHNEHQWPEFVELARNLGVDGVVEVAGGVRTAEEAEEFLPQAARLRKYDEDALAQGELRRKVQTPCRFAWNAALISCDGMVHPCPKDHFNAHACGSVHELRFREIWNGSRMRSFRSRLLREGNFTSECYYCPGYGGTSHWKHYSPRCSSADSLWGEKG